jgi:hypothetical protein
MRREPGNSISKTRGVGIRPAIIWEILVIALVIVLMLWGKVGTWLLNSMRFFLGH